MNQKEIKELIELLVEKDIAEFELERGDVKAAHQARGNGSSHVVQVAPALPAGQPIAMTVAPHCGTSGVSRPAAAAQPPTEAAAQAASDADLHIVKSPIVGTFYEAPSPGTPPFVKVGDTVKEGQVLCIIEAMKLMNEIEADVSGEIVKVFVSNGSPVEYGMPLFGIRKQ